MNQTNVCLLVLMKYKELKPIINSPIKYKITFYNSTNLSFITLRNIKHFELLEFISELRLYEIDVIGLSSSSNMSSIYYRLSKFRNYIKLFVSSSNELYLIEDNSLIIRHFNSRIDSSLIELINNNQLSLTNNKLQTQLFTIKKELENKLNQIDSLQKELKTTNKNLIETQRNFNQYIIYNQDDSESEF